MATEKVETTKKKITTTKDGRRFIEKTPYEKEMVTGTFENKDAPGQKQDFNFGYNGTVEKYTLYDGMKKTVPRYIATHINNCTYRDSEPEYNERGMIIGKKPIIKKRFNFYSSF